MEYNERNITAVEVYKELKEVKKQNQEILARLEDMQESNAIFHNCFSSIFEALQILNEVKQNEKLVDMLDSGSLANILCASSWRKKWKKAEDKKQEQNRKAETVGVKRARDLSDVLKMLKNI